MEGIMINGTHLILYTRDAAADRAFIRDTLRFPGVDAGDGWLVFKLPPAEIRRPPNRWRIQARAVPDV